ncbi:MAG: polyribonucleotide nucleotidyltransferase [bacterium]|nr:polyribonucleotide nucleotidyltransferase [bacterium]MDZ4295902.1 polyribonucleotide nucleotidyltransferase [Patescibacteria group bacterium]
MQHTFQTEIAGRMLKVETGKLAEHASGAAVIQYGDTVLLATAVMGGERTGIDYFPLTVDYDEKLYAAGRIKGSRWVKREGRPTDEAILSGRLIDRAIRPRFDHRLRRDIQVIITVLSFDNENDPDVLALIGASLALGISNIPWDGPIAGVRIGRIDERWVINPTYAEREVSDLDIALAGTKDRINMIEAGAKEVPEEVIAAAAELAQQEIAKIIAFQEDVIRTINTEKMPLVAAAPDATLHQDFAAIVGDRLGEAMFREDMGHRWSEEARKLKDAFVETVAERHHDESKRQAAAELFEEKVNEVLHRNILEKGRRPDGRAADELRELRCMTGMLPRTHGSGLFQRGETQVLSVLTLGAPGLEQHLESMEIVGTKRFMHHYNFPPFSVGETGRLSGPGRREIGHGALAERALEPLLPPKAEFPYAIRIVSEVLSSNGSSSMASVCGSTLALMDAGVPLKKPVAGIAMGLVTDSAGNYRVLTDIQGPEDHHGDMDLKVAGTADGITAMQMDVKIDGITIAMLRDGLLQARKARLEILRVMRSEIEKPRENLSPYAPRVFTVQINPQRIRDVIGPGGKTIHAITEQTGVTIDIEDSGLVFVTAPKEDAAKKALEWIENLTHEIKEGEVFQGKVSRIMDFGAIVELLPGQDGLVHISELAHWRVNRVEDIVKVGGIIPVKVIAVHPDGKISLSHKATQEPPEHLPEGGERTGGAPRPMQGGFARHRNGRP